MNRQYGGNYGRDQFIIENVQITSLPNGQELLSSGIQLLSQRSYNQAANVLRDAVRTDPLLSEARYYLAIALLGGKKPRKIDEWTIRDIEENLDAATKKSSSDSKYYALWAIVKYGFYTMNGFIENSPTSIQLFSLGERIQSECAQEILYHLNDHSNPYWLSLYHKFGKTH